MNLTHQREEQSLDLQEVKNNVNIRFVFVISSLIIFLFSHRLHSFSFRSQHKSTGVVTSE